MVNISKDKIRSIILQQYQHNTYIECFQTHNEIIELVDKIFQEALNAKKDL